MSGPCYADTADKPGNSIRRIPLATRKSSSTSVLSTRDTLGTRTDRCGARRANRIGQRRPSTPADCPLTVLHTPLLVSIRCGSHCELPRIGSPESRGLRLPGALAQPLSHCSFTEGQLGGRRFQRVIAAWTELELAPLARCTDTVCQPLQNNVARSPRPGLPHLETVATPPGHTARTPLR